MNCKSVTIFLALASLGAIFSCSLRIERDPSVLIETLSADPPTLNPILSKETGANAVNSRIYESLLEMDNETLKFKPKLARRWEVAPDHLRYTFWLRNDVKWHDGEPLTADDVVYTFERIQDPRVDAASLRNYFRDLKQVEKLGPYIVRFTYARPYFRALDMLGLVSIIPKHTFDDGTDFNSHAASRAPLGTGPYHFVEWKSGQNIKLERSEGYWGEKPHVSGVYFKVIPNQTTAFALLKKGALDLSVIRAIQWTKQTGSKEFGEKFSKFRYYTPICFFVGWNMRRPFFEDRRVRIAMTMLINRKEILNKVLFGEGEMVLNDFYRFGPVYDTSIEPYPYDIEGAARLLDEAGWSDHDGDGLRDKDGVPFTFTVLFPAGSQLGRSLSLFMREDFSRVGIEVNVQQLEWATMLRLIDERDFDATMLGWAMPINHDPYQVWHSSQAKDGSNFVGFGDARADKIIEEARQEFDEGRRIALYREFQGIIHREEPYTFLFTTPSLVAVAKRFTNVKTYRLGLDPLEWNVAPWPVLVEW